MNIKFYKYPTVTEPEIKKMMSKPQFKKFFSKLDEMATIPGFPTKWLITSIDRQTRTGQLRYPVERGNHVDSNAVDIVPLQPNMVIRLPIPLNRNMVFMGLFKQQFDQISDGPLSLPIIAFEADHIHVDIMHPYSVALLNKTRSFLDAAMHKLAHSNTVLNKIVNSEKLLPVPSLL